MLVKAMQGIGRPVAYYPELNKITGSVTATILLCQLIYWSERTQDTDGWIYKTRADFASEIGLSRYELEGARKKLRTAGLIEEKLEGMPARLHYRIIEQAIDQVWIDQNRDLYAETPLVGEIPPARWGESSKQGGGNSPGKVGEIPPTALKSLNLKTETTAEITAENDPVPEIGVDEITQLLSDQAWVRGRPKDVNAKLVRMIQLNPDLSSVLTLANVDQFVEYHGAKPPSKQPRSWNAALRNWLKKVIEYDEQATAQSRSRRNGKVTRRGKQLGWYSDQRPPGNHPIPERGERDPDVQALLADVAFKT